MNFLEKIKNEIENCSKCKIRMICNENNLQPAFPAGSVNNPLMLVFINPTPKNLTTHKNWKGDRVFFFGDLRFWRFLMKVDLFNSKVFNQIEKSRWDPNLIPLIQNELEKQKIYITNLVKCPTPDASYPSKEILKACRKFLEKEIEYIKPRKIIAFGSFTYQELAGKKIKLKEYFSSLNQNSFKDFILPCYFPTGRGNLKLAIMSFRKLLQQFTY